MTKIKAQIVYLKVAVMLFSLKNRDLNWDHFKGIPYLNIRLNVSQEALINGTVERSVGISLWQ